MTFYGKTNTVERPKHPSSQWANWKNWVFSAWDREAQEEKEITLPEEFVVVADSWSIKGWLETKWNVWSNEIYSFKEDILTVRNNAGEVLYEGKYADIKPELAKVWLKPTRNIHYVDPKDYETLKTFCIKGAASKAWFDSFSWENSRLPGFKRIKLAQIKDWKTGAVKYKYPIFEWASDLTAEDRVAQQKWEVSLINYKNATITTEDELAESKVVKEDAVDELPFN